MNSDNSIGASVDTSLLKSVMCSMTHRACASHTENLIQRPSRNWRYLMVTERKQYGEFPCGATSERNVTRRGAIRVHKKRQLIVDSDWLRLMNDVNRLSHIKL